MGRAYEFPDGKGRHRVLLVHQGECTLSADQAVTLSTVLGSCVSACIRDRVAGVGGMNHFLLAAPAGQRADRFGAPARYGAYAMELLINRVLAAGTGQKSNLEIKVFGGGVINPALTDIGAGNLAFLHRFLTAEGYATASHDVGGAFARRVLFKPTSGRALVKRLDAGDAAAIARQELEIARRPPLRALPEPEVELF